MPRCSRNLAPRFAGHPPTSIIRHVGGVVLAAVLIVVPAATAGAQAAAAEQYERTLAREDAARATARPTLAALRAIATAYEAIVRRFPRSGYADNALWNAARVLQAAHGQFGQDADRDKAARLLDWLRREYPHSSLARQDPPAPLLASTDSPAARSETTPAPPPGVSAPPPPGGGAAVRAITRSSLPRGDRITIELTREVPYAADRLSDPDRIFVDLTNTSTAPSLIDRAAAELSGRLVKGTRVGVHLNGSSRVVLDVTGQPRFSTFPLYNPFRLVIDVESDTLAGQEAAASPAIRVAAAAPPAGDPTALVSATPPRPPPPAPTAPSVTSRGNYSLARQLGLRISRVVIDPGHGGHDPGARANGLTEAELVLDVALRLEELLREEGVDVVLTRRTNTFVPLEERTAIANRMEADLFVSVHANASPRPATSGIETYFLNFATNQQAEAVAARENASSAKTMGTLPTLLKAIALNNKLAESRELATLVQGSLMRTVSAKRRAVQSLGVKQAPFVVLIGAQMPSVLAEIGFITNRAEATLLKQPAGRHAVAEGLFEAIVKYQAALKSDQAVAIRREAR